MRSIGLAYGNRTFNLLLKTRQVSADFMSILVTGGAGYIGSHMVWRLVEAGEKVIVVDNLVTGFAWAVAPEAEFVNGDCGDADLLSRLIDRYAVDTIIHFAASVVVPDSVADPLAYYLNNTARARTVVEAAVKGKVRHFIFSSTAAVYGRPTHNPVGEDALLKPESPYGRSKMMVEMMLADTAAAHDLNYVALRYFNVAGADPVGRVGQSTRGATHLIQAACQTVLGKRSEIVVFGTDYPTPDGTCVRDYIHVSDLVAAHADALKYLRSGGGNFVGNCGYGHGFSVHEVLDTVKRVSGEDFKIVLGERRMGDPASIIASPALIKERFGWQPRHDNLDDIVRSALAWEVSPSNCNHLE